MHSTWAGRLAAGIADDCSLRGFFLPIVEGDQGSKPRAQLAAQCARTITPFPVSADRAGKIHARRAAQAQHILQRDNRNVSDRSQHRPDHDPIDLGIVVEVELSARKVVFFANIFGSASTVASPGTRPPPHRRVIVVAAGVGDQVLTVIVRTKRRTLNSGTIPRCVKYMVPRRNPNAPLSFATLPGLEKQRQTNAPTENNPCHSSSSHRSPDRHGPRCAIQGDHRNEKSFYGVANRTDGCIMVRFPRSKRKFRIK